MVDGPAAGCVEQVKGNVFNVVESVGSPLSAYTQDGYPDVFFTYTVRTIAIPMEPISKCPECLSRLEPIAFRYMAYHDIGLCGRVNGNDPAVMAALTPSIASCEETLIEKRTLYCNGCHRVNPGQIYNHVAKETTKNG
jgi:hypothetical protein